VIGYCDITPKAMAESVESTYRPYVRTRVKVFMRVSCLSYWPITPKAMAESVEITYRPYVRTSVNDFMAVSFCLSY